MEVQRPLDHILSHTRARNNPTKILSTNNPRATRTSRTKPTILHQITISTIMLTDDTFEALLDRGQQDEARNVEIDASVAEEDTTTIFTLMRILYLARIWCQSPQPVCYWTKLLGIFRNENSNRVLQEVTHWNARKEVINVFIENNVNIICRQFIPNLKI